MMKKFFVFIMLPSLLMLTDQVMSTDRSMEFIISNRKNVSGHWNLTFALGKVSPNFKDKFWTFKMNYDVPVHDGKQNLLLKGSLLVPPSPPDDYEFYPGIGYYKFYPNQRETFENASRICEKSGGHLAIINSEAEANVLKAMYAPHVKDNDTWARLGFNDRHGKGDFRTIFGVPLSSSGYMKWGPKEPDWSGGIINCGCMNNEGFIGTQCCSCPRHFLCEFDLSWADRSH